MRPKKEFPSRLMLEVIKNYNEYFGAEQDNYSGIIHDGKEVEMVKLSDDYWAIDIVRHTSDDTKEFVGGWTVSNEKEALALYHEKVEEITAQEEEE